MRIRNRITDRFIPRSNFLYQCCSRYVNFFENHCGDPILNGEQRFAEEILPSARLVCDVGANIGDWATMALNINRNIELHCFEPSKQTFLQLLTRKFPPNVIVNNIGLGSEKCIRTLYSDHPCSGCAALFKREGVDCIRSETFQEEIVQINTLDNYVQERGLGPVDFVKIDVEGYELEVIKGMRGIINRGDVQIIQFEYNKTYIDARIFLKDVWDLVHDTNTSYRFYEIFPNRIKLHEKYSQKMENFLYQNWAIIKK